MQIFIINNSNNNEASVSVAKNSSSSNNSNSNSNGNVNSNVDKNGSMQNLITKATLTNSFMYSLNPKKCFEIFKQQYGGSGDVHSVHALNDEIKFWTVIEHLVT